MATVLVVGSDEATRRGIGGWLSPAHDECVTAATGTAACALASSRRIDVVVIDWSLSNEDGLRLFSDIRRIQADVVGVIISGNGTIPVAVEAMRLGAFTFLQRPVDAGVLKDAIVGACQQAANDDGPAAAFEAPAAHRIAIGILAIACRRADTRSIDEWATLLRVSRGGLRGWCDAARVHAGAALSLGRALRVYRLVRATDVDPADVVGFSDRRSIDRFLAHAGIPDALAARALTIDGFCAGQQFVRRRLVLTEIAHLWAHV
jgi:ActR/RegA family two-component response regulator